MSGQGPRVAVCSGNGELAQGMHDAGGGTIGACQGSSVKMIQFGSFDLK